MRKWMLAAFVSCAVVVAQTKPTDVFEKAPPQIDDALRENVAKFFKAHVDGKFRQAEEVIAEDSKDFFYNMEKQRYFSFEIVRINYSRKLHEGYSCHSRRSRMALTTYRRDARKTADDQSLEARERQMGLVCQSSKGLGYTLGQNASRT